MKYMNPPIVASLTALLVLLILPTSIKNDLLT